MCVMIKHKYHVGDRVRLLVGALDGDVPAGSYMISRLLPVEGAVCRYRVQHERDRHERVVREEQVALAMPQAEPSTAGA
jgi:hypothetical protein